MGEQIVAIAAARIVDLPPSLRPQQLELHFEPTLPPNTPAIAAVEVHTASRSLIVTRSAMRLPSSIWLHEMAHLAMRGPRPQPLTASRVVDAIEEAFADVVAALILNDSIVGGSGWPLRDLAASPSFDEGFEQLGLPEAFDPHPLGLALARRLWSLRDLLQPSPLTSCLNQAEGLRVSRSIRQAVTSVVSGCPQSVKQPVAEALNLWLPQGLSVNRLN